MINLNIQNIDENFFSINYKGQLCVINKNEPDTMFIVTTRQIMVVPEEIQEPLTEAMKLLSMAEADEAAADKNNPNDKEECKYNKEEEPKNDTTTK